MALPTVKEAQPFYRAAQQRLEDAAFLMDADRTTAAVYLAGYSVECILKALILAQAGRTKAPDLLRSFRGSGAHNYDWLRFLYKGAGGPPFPRDIVKSFLVVDSWGTDLRYETGTINPKEAKAFLAAAQQIWTWADGRL